MSHLFSLSIWFHLVLFTFVTRVSVSDLVPREAVEKWLKYLREELPALAYTRAKIKLRVEIKLKGSKTKQSSTN